MSEAPRVRVGEPRRRPGTFFLAVAMLVALPLVAIQGPAHTTPMDAVNVLFVGLYWCYLLARRERVEFPLALPFWLILLGSFTGLYAAYHRSLALLVLVQDIYLYLWFVTLSHFLARYCRLRSVATIWVAVACGVALLTFADAHMGLFGGRFAGTARSRGTFENPNMFGDYLVVSFFVTWATAAAGKRLFYLALPLLAGGVLATHSNGSLMSLLGGCGAVVAAHRFLWTTRRVGALLVLAGLGLGIVGVFHDHLEEVAVERLGASRGEVGGAALKGAS